MVPNPLTILNIEITPQQWITSFSLHFDLPNDTLHFFEILCKLKLLRTYLIYIIFKGNISNRVNIYFNALVVKLVRSRDSTSTVVHLLKVQKWVEKVLDLVFKKHREKSNFAIIPR